ncbi:MAG: hypothetical protein V4510_08250 [bacterium]
MWAPLLQPGLALLHGSGRDVRGFSQELAHFALRTHPGHVLWCDGDHGFDPYDFAELNLTRGLAADDGAQRMLIKRCMTPFQWDTVLTKHLPEKLAQTEASLALVVPFDRLFSTDELADWEAEDYTRYAVRHLRNVARRHRIPIMLGLDMARWWKSHPVLAQLTYDAADVRWSVAATAGRWRVTPEIGVALDPMLAHRTTLLDYAEPEPVLERPVALHPHRPTERRLQQT